MRLAAVFCSVLLFSMLFGLFCLILVPTPKASLLSVVTNYCLIQGIYSKKIDYKNICFIIERESQEFTNDAYLMTAYAIKESKFITNAVHTNFLKNGKFTIDQGLFQINSIWNFVQLKGTSKNPMFNVELNTHAACDIFSQGRDRFPDSIFNAIRQFNGFSLSNESYSGDVLEIYYRLNLIKQQQESKKSTLGEFLWNCLK